MKITGELDYECWANRRDDFYPDDIVTINNCFGLDYRDSEMLETIIDKFLESNWAEREEIYKKITE